jgi:hypothetical protein
MLGCCAVSLVAANVAGGFVDEVVGEGEPVVAFVDAAWLDDRYLLVETVEDDEQRTLHVIDTVESSQTAYPDLMLERVDAGVLAFASHVSTAMPDSQLALSSLEGAGSAGVDPVVIASSVPEPRPLGPGQADRTVPLIGGGRLHLDTPGHGVLPRRIVHETRDGRATVVFESRPYDDGVEWVGTSDDGRYFAFTLRNVGGTMVFVARSSDGRVMGRTAARTAGRVTVSWRPASHRLTVFCTGVDDEYPEFFEVRPADVPTDAIAPGPADESLAPEGTYSEERVLRAVFGPERPMEIFDADYFDGPPDGWRLGPRTFVPWRETMPTLGFGDASLDGMARSPAGTIAAMATEIGPLMGSDRLTVRVIDPGGRVRKTIVIGTQE